MSTSGTIAIKGTSGKAYVFKTFSLDTVFDEGQGGVYVLTKRKFNKTTRTKRHKPLILGQNSDLHQPNVDTSDPLYAEANCICILEEMDENTRQGIHQDLVSSAL